MPPSVQRRRSSNDDAKSEKRKLRNRISQQAFRARQGLRIQELEERLQDLTKPNAARIGELQDQNTVLRNQLFECHKKLTSFEISLNELKTATALALGISSSDDQGPKSKRCDRCNQSEREHSSSPEFINTLDGSLEEPQQEQQEQQQETRTFSQVEDFSMLWDPPIEPFLKKPDGSVSLDLRSQQLALTQPTAMSPPDTWIPSGEEQESCPIQSHILDSEVSQEFPAPDDNFDLNPEDWDALATSSSIQCALDLPSMGLDAYQHISNGSPLRSPSPENLPRTNSLFSDHINALEYLCVRNWDSSKSMLKKEYILRLSLIFEYQLTGSRFAQAVHVMLLAFVDISWSSMTTWHSCTGALIPLRDIMVWRLTRTRHAFLNIVPSYRPTKLQMTVNYPSIIDWTPWPSLRDQIILRHSASPRLDDLICEIGDSYVVPADLSELVTCPQSVLGYVAVWDLVRAIDPTADRYFDTRSSQTTTGSTSAHERLARGFNAFYNVARNIEENDTSSDRLPAPNAKALFSKRPLALQAFRLLGMDRGAFCFCLDPAFFEKHPELYRSQEHLMASGVALKPDTREFFPKPHGLNFQVIQRYEEVSKYALDAANATILAVA